MENISSRQSNRMNDCFDRESNINNIIDRMTLLLMLNQVVEAKGLCTRVIEEIKREKSVDEKIADIMKEADFS